MQANEGRELTLDRLIGRANFEDRTRRRFVEFEMPFAIEAILAWRLARLDADQTDLEPRVAIAGKRQRAGDMDDADNVGGFDVVANDVARADQDFGAGCRNRAAVPGF